MFHACRFIKKIITYAPIRQNNDTTRCMKPQSFFMRHNGGRVFRCSIKRGMLRTAKRRLIGWPRKKKAASRKGSGILCSIATTGGQSQHAWRPNSISISTVKHAASSSTSTARSNLAKAYFAKARDFSLAVEMPVKGNCQAVT